MNPTESLQSPKGTHDVLPHQIPAWRFIEETFRALCARHNFGEIRTPAFEHTEVFARTAGESSDVMVTKQMYSFVANDGDSYTLRAEGTAPAVRAYLQHNLAQRGPVTKLFYICPVFRYEAPQSGRYRQHHQCGIELLGATSPESDAAVLALAHEFLQDLGIDAALHLNSLGTPDSRRAYVAAVRAHLEPKFDTLSEDSKKRFELNPLRIFDSKDERDREALKGAPRLLDALRESDPESLEHFETLCARLDDLGIPYQIDHELVRGFDYYTRTAFEFVSDKLGAQSTVLGGGRYDGLVQELGGTPTPGIGFGSGIERLMLVREAMGLETPAVAPPRAFLVLMGDVARAHGPKILQRLRTANISCDCDFVGRSVKAQMREAGRQNAPYVLLLGEDELAQNSVTLKNMADSSQQTMPFEDAISVLKNL
jgi:histidyl-tRNA synthetase